MWHVLPADRKPQTTNLLMTMLPCETMFECQERKYVEQHKGALHKPLPTALMNKAFKHFQQDQSENSVGAGGHRRNYNSFV